MSDTPDGTDALDYDPEANVYRIDYDPARERPSLVLVSAVAEITGAGPTDLPFLQESLSSESLDDLFAPTESGRSRGTGRVEFTYHDFRVTVYSYGAIELRPTDAED